MIDFIQVLQDEWQYFDFSWSESLGLSVYINNRLVASTSVATQRIRTSSATSQIAYIGRAVSELVSTNRVDFAIEDFAIYDTMRAELTDRAVFVFDGKK